MDLVMKYMRPTVKQNTNKIVMSDMRTNATGNPSMMRVNINTSNAPETYTPQDAMKKFLYFLNIPGSFATIRNISIAIDTIRKITAAITE